MHETGPFDVRLDRTDEWVRAVATLAGANAPSVHRPVSTGIERLGVPGADPSRTVRELVCAAIGSRMNLPPGLTALGLAWVWRGGEMARLSLIVALAATAGMGLALLVDPMAGLIIISK